MMGGGGGGGGEGGKFGIENNHQAENRAEN